MSTQAKPMLALHRANCANCGHPHYDHGSWTGTCFAHNCKCDYYIEDTPEAATCRCGHMAANHAQNIAKCKIGNCDCWNFDKGATE